MKQTLLAFFRTYKNILKALLAIVLLAGFIVAQKYSRQELVAWKNITLAYGTLAAAAICGGGIFYIAASGTFKKRWIKIVCGILGMAITALVPLVALYFNNKIANGQLASEYLHNATYLAIGITILAFIWAIFATFKRSRKTFAKAVAVILIGIFIASFFSDWSPVNYVHKNEYMSLKSQEVTTCSLSDNTLNFTVKTTKTGETLNCALSNCGKSGWRLQTEFDGKIDDQGAGQLLSYYLDEECGCGEKCVLNVSEKNGKQTLVAEDGSKAVIEYSPLKVTFYSNSGAESATICTIGVSNGTTVVRGKLLKKEAMWGGGEHFDHINQRGRHISINSIDMWSKTEGNSYMPIPILVSSRGSGLFMNRYERMTIDVDSNDVPNDIWQFAVPNAPCDLFVYATDTPADVLYGYSTIAGFAPEVAEWNYGIMVCRYAPEFCTLDGMIAMETAMEEADMPWDGIIIEGFDSSDAESLKVVCDYMHSKGKKVMVYTASGRLFYLLCDTELVKFVSRADNGSINIPESYIDNPVDHPGVGTSVYVDITDDATAEYLFDVIWGNLVNEIGIDGAKIDFCEQFPDFIELTFADGVTSGAHHWYSTTYNCMLRRALEGNENGTYTLTRGGGIGAERYPFVWMGDQMREMRFSAAVLKGVISSGISGVPFTTYDMAGYNAGYIGDEEEVFMRSVEYSAFIGSIQTHGSVKRPYDYPENVQNVYRAYTKIHEALRPYLVEQGKISSSTGLPLVRHLAIEYWQDENVWDIEDEFMLGGDILIAPVLEEGETSRTIYLPEGEWINLWTGEKLQGGRYLQDYSVPLEDVPVFIKADISSEVLADCLDDVKALYLTRK